MSDKLLDQEFILRSDGKFYKRTTVMSPVHDADQVLSAVKDNGIPVPYPFEHVVSIPTGDRQFPMQTMVYSNAPHVLHTFTRLNEFPFPNSYLITSDDPDNGDDCYHLGIGNRHDVGQERLGEATDLVWDPTVDHLKLYVSTTFNFRDNSIGTPFLFVVDDTNMPYVPNLPNVFDDGRICTGPDYFTRFDSKSDVLAMHQANINNFYRTPCNNDLRNRELERRYVKFTSAGRTKPILHDPGIINNDDLSFYITCTNSRIIDFLKNV